MRSQVTFWLAAAFALTATATAQATIFPFSTPIRFLQQSDLVAVVTCDTPDAKQHLTVRIREVLKGKRSGDTLTIDLSTALPDITRAAIDTLKENGDAPALLFIGTYKFLAMNYDPEAPPEKHCYLHSHHKWFDAISGEKGGWELDIKGFPNYYMTHTWPGATDMFIRLVRHILRDPKAEVPVEAGVVWRTHRKIAAFPGKVHALAAVDLAGDGKTVFFAAHSAGDRLLAFQDEAQAFKDITAERGLASQSQQFVWADFNADGRNDFASWDGRALALYIQGANGEFTAQPVNADLNDGCVGLAVLDVDAKGRPGVLLSTSAAPVLLTPDKDGALVKRTFPALPAFTEKPGPAGPCLVADFDGDNLPDVVQSFAACLVFYKGRGAGGFQAPKIAGTYRLLGPGMVLPSATTGDFDHDGLLDILIADDVYPHLYQNRGAGQFEEALNESGSIAYISKPDATTVQVCDVNYDGRQDAFITYSTNSPPQVFFNHGFRCFDHAHELAIEEWGFLEEANQGQQTGLIADLNGDGAQDMVIVEPKGAAWAFYGAQHTRGFLGRTTTAPKGRTYPVLRVALPLGGSYVGPLTVTAWTDTRCLGAWNLVAGSQEALFARGGPGPIELRWQIPGQPARKKTVTLTNQPQRLVLQPDE